MLLDYSMIFISTLLLSLLITPLIKKIAYVINAVDHPKERKVHNKVMPRMGGVGIYLSFIMVYSMYIYLSHDEFNETNLAIMLGGLIIVLTGVIDDLYQISPKKKLIGQFIAALIVLSFDIRLDFVFVPFLDNPIHFGWFSYPLTILWIIGITNSINLIDGLDGLASGVSAIAGTTLFLIALMMGDFFIAALCLAFVGSILGFLFYNFHPASIFMGDSGSLFLGFFLSVVSLIGFKQVTITAFVIPILFLAVPISDTLYAMLRRKLNHTPISSPDKNHLHHCLLELGFSHRKTVLVIYGISVLFSLLAILMTKLSLWVSLVVLFFYFIFFHFLAEYVGMISKKKPLISFFIKFFQMKK